jgi:hypothetical protein
MVGDEVGGKVGGKDSDEFGRNDDGDAAADVEATLQMKRCHKNPNVMPPMDNDADDRRKCRRRRMTQTTDDDANDRRQRRRQTTTLMTDNDPGNGR